MASIELSVKEALSILGFLREYFNAENVDRKELFMMHQLTNDLEKRLLSNCSLEDIQEGILLIKTQQFLGYAPPSKKDSSSETN